MTYMTTHMTHVLKVASLALIATFAPIQGIALSVLALVLIDLVTGVVAAYKRGDKITSRGFRRTVVKIFVYEIAIGSAFLAETYLTGPRLAILKLITTLVGGIELKSILENLDSVSGGSLFKTLIDRLAAPQGPKDGPERP